MNNQLSAITLMYNFSKQGKHLIKPITISKLRLIILIAKILTLDATVVKQSARNFFSKQKIKSGLSL